MSRSGAQLDFYVALLIGQGVNAERGLRVGESQPEAFYPGAFVHSPNPTPAPLVCLQRDITTQVIVDIWVKKETQEQVLVRGEAFEDAIAADPTLGGIVDSAIVVDMPIGEFRDIPFKVARVIVESKKVL